MEILLQIIEEEVDVAFKQIAEAEGESVSGVGPLRRGSFLGTLWSPVTDLKTIALSRGAEALTKGVKTVAQLVANTVSGILPFNKSTNNAIDHYFDDWEDKALGMIDHQFAKERKEMEEGWDTFKNDFWGIGFVASPMNAVAGLAVGAQGLDAAMSVLNIVSGGRAERVADLLTGERRAVGEAVAHKKRGTTLLTGKRKREYYHEAAEQESTRFKNLPEDQKKKIFDEIMKNPEVLNAVEKWSKTNLSTVMHSFVGNMNKLIASGKAGNVSPEEIAKYKSGSMPSDFVKTFLNKVKKEEKKFKVEPSQETLQAAEKAVAEEIKKMPDQTVATQPQQTPGQPPVQPQQTPASGTSQPAQVAPATSVSTPPQR